MQIPYTYIYNHNADSYVRFAILSAPTSAWVHYEFLRGTGGKTPDGRPVYFKHLDFLISLN